MQTSFWCAWSSPGVRHHQSLAPRRRHPQTRSRSTPLLSVQERIHAWTHPMSWLAAGFRMSRADGPCITCQPQWFLVPTNRCPCQSTRSPRRECKPDMPCSGGSPCSLWARTRLPDTVSVDPGPWPVRTSSSTSTLRRPCASARTRSGRAGTSRSRPPGRRDPCRGSRPWRTRASSCRTRSPGPRSGRVLP